MKGLYSIVEKFPYSTLQKIVLPPLIEEVSKSSPISHFVLPILLLVAKNQTQGEFSHLLLPHLKKTFGSQEPRILYVLINNMHVLLQKCDEETKQNSLFPILSRCLSLNQPKLNNASLLILPQIFSLAKNESLFSDVFSSLLTLASKTQVGVIRVNLITCLSKLQVSNEIYSAFFVPILKTVLSEDQQNVELVKVCFSFAILVATQTRDITLICKYLIPTLSPLLPLLFSEKSEVYFEFTASLLSLIKITESIKKDTERPKSVRRDVEDVTGKDFSPSSSFFLECIKIF